MIIIGEKLFFNALYVIPGVTQFLVNVFFHILYSKVVVFLKKKKGQHCY